ncbi:phytanoyl-CoA dioxygenase family protein [Paraferrimonas haliotis]|uniref:SnoK protein n=1 Tax=Paraferrimonas haliotis TaxID=2013866 RepID=A0AA37TT02_9GAMM|nr:phytanoyl-CoA dioxygenase family protein [Paraferrimonas haliotis]GLS83712.1 SnoK protein [Paraferrimonas haliotis]
MSQLLTPIEVSPTLIEQFKRDGHVRIDQLLTEQEVGEFRAVVNAAVADRRTKIEQIPLEERDTYGKAFLQIMNLWEEYQAVAHWVLSKKLASVAAQLLEVDKVRVYHDQALYKEAGGGITPWHQDQYYWPLETNKFVTMWMPLMDVTQLMGTLDFASGTGNVGYLGDIPISDESEAILGQMCKERGFEIVNHGDMSAGDATFHSGWCLHSASNNASSVLREAMTIIWFEDGARIIDDPDPQQRWNKGRRDDMQRWLPDRSPGQVADGRLTPLISPFDPN